MNFPNPPITEAIFDIRVSLSDETRLEKLELFQESIKNEFPDKRIKMRFEGGFSIKDGISPEITPPSTSQEGYVFSSQDHQKFIQARLDGFTFSKLKPYDSWKSFYGEAYKLWRYYVDTVRPQEVIRIALRYINRIEIPFEGPLDLKDYVRTTPEISDELPTTIIDYFMRLVVTHKSYGPSLGIISQAIENTSKENSERSIFPLILDIDVFQEVSLIPYEDDDKIRNIFEENLHNFKNDIFFKSITKKTEELFR